MTTAYAGGRRSSRVKDLVDLGERSFGGDRELEFAQVDLVIIARTQANQVRR